MLMSTLDGIHAIIRPYSGSIRLQIFVQEVTVNKTLAVLKAQNFTLFEVLQHQEPYTANLLSTIKIIHICHKILS